jgi:hypothetical protein
MPAETFMVYPDDEEQKARPEEPELMTQLAPLLRARGDLGAET